jgi:LuxR family maltose regulon positive regulatory protein
MADVLIETKLRPPVLRDGLVTRGRLLKALDGALATRLVVLSAPAGFGKSTLLGQWIVLLRERGAAVAWLALDQGDDEIGRFLHLSGRRPAASRSAIGARRPGAADQPVLPVDSVLTTIVNDLALRSRPLFLIR